MFFFSSLPRTAALALIWFVASFATVPAGARGLIELPAPLSYPGEMQTQAREGAEAIDDKKVEKQKTNSYGLSLEGAYAYTVSNGTVNMRADKVANNRSYGTSGTIRLELWAFASPYGGTSSFQVSAPDRTVWAHALIAVHRANAKGIVLMAVINPIP